MWNSQVQHHFQLHLLLQTSNVKRNECHKLVNPKLCMVHALKTKVHTRSHPNGLNVLILYSLTKWCIQTLVLTKDIIWYQFIDKNTSPKYRGCIQMGSAPNFQMHCWVLSILILLLVVQACKHSTTQIIHKLSLWIKTTRIHFWGENKGKENAHKNCK